MSESGDLEPSVSPSCVVCRGRVFELRCNAAELAAQQVELAHFHRARLARRRRGELAERAQFTQDYVTDLVACLTCGLLMRSPRPRAREVARAYEDDEYPPERIADLFEAQAASFRGKLADLASLGAPHRILEIGSFVGAFLHVAREAGLDAVGLDPGQQLAKYCAERQLPVLQGTLEELAPSLCHDPYDAITIWNTFDQLPDPRATLKLAARCVRPDGVLAIRVPHGLAFEKLLRRFRSANAYSRHAAKLYLAWNNLLSFPYLMGYGIATLDRIADGFGFERALVRGDVLCRLASRDTAHWARSEERIVKAVQRVGIERQMRKEDVRLRTAPWIDVYYRYRP
jgi:SAM-dependent methyltransferase